MNFLHKESNGVYAVWLSEVNRFIILKEPAFRVFSQWSENLSENEITDEIVKHYNLSPLDAKRFFNEITDQLNVLVLRSSGKDLPLFKNESKTSSPNNLFSRNYNLNGKIIQINYINSFIEQNIHPRLLHLSDNNKNKNIDKTFSLTSSEGQFFLEPGDGQKRSFKLIEELAGGLYLQLLYIMHEIPEDSWMGVAHASAITDGKEAILFMAPSGGGKSTIGALMIANGFKLLSDDFVPIALTEPEIYCFPAGISVKKTAMPFLKEFFPEIDDMVVTDRPGINKNGVYLPFPANSISSQNAKAKAIVFVQYDKSVQCRFKKQPNHELMNQFVSESWIADNPVAAGRFLDWYFNLDIYTLQYSDSKRAVARIKKIFKG